MKTIQCYCTFDYFNFGSISYLNILKHLKLCLFNISLFYCFYFCYCLQFVLYGCTDMKILADTENFLYLEADNRYIGQ